MILPTFARSYIIEYYFIKENFFQWENPAKKNYKYQMELLFVKI